MHLFHAERELTVVAKTLGGRAHLYAMVNMRDNSTCKALTAYQHSGQCYRTFDSLVMFEVRGPLDSSPCSKHDEKGKTF